MYKNTPVWIVKTTDGITDHKAVTSFFILIPKHASLETGNRYGTKKNADGKGNKTKLFKI